MPYFNSKEKNQYQKLLIQSLNILNDLLLLYQTSYKPIPILIHQSYFSTYYELFELTNDPGYLNNMQTHMQRFFPADTLNQIVDQEIERYRLYIHKQHEKLIKKNSIKRQISIVDDEVVRPTFARISTLLRSSNNSTPQTPASESRSSENLKQHGTEKKRGKALVTYSVLNTFHDYENNDDDPPPIRLKRHKVG